MKVKSFLAMALVALLATGCSDDDEPAQNVSGGVQEIKVTASDDSKWFYVDLKNAEVTAATITENITYLDMEDKVVEEKAPEKVEGSVPANWDIAMNGFNIRTNNGAVLVSQATDFASLTEVPAGNYVQDKTVKATDKLIRVDMSRMQEGIMGYVGGFVNETLSSNIKKTPTGTMPPYEYSINDSEHVYVIKFTNGNWAKVKFVKCSYGSGKKSVNFSYEYMSK